MWTPPSWEIDEVLLKLCQPCQLIDSTGRQSAAILLRAMSRDPLPESQDGVGDDPSSRRTGPAV